MIKVKIIKRGRWTGTLNTPGHHEPDRVLEEKECDMVPPIWEGCYITVNDESHSVDFTNWDITDNELTIWVK